MGDVPFRCINFPYPKRHRSAPIVVKKSDKQKVKTQRNQCVYYKTATTGEKGPTQFQRIVRITHVICRRRRKKKISHVNAADDDEKATDLNGRECPSSAWHLCIPSGYTTWKKKENLENTSRVYFGKSEHHAVSLP